MALESAQSSLLTAGIVALIIWRVYRRVQRMVGRQRLHPVRPWFTAVLFPLLLVVTGLSVLAQPLSLSLLAGGVAVGVGLGIYGTRLTKFEVTPEGRFYTPNAHLGLALSLLFIGRIAYRMVQMNMLMGGMPDQSHADFARSPLTLALFGLMAGYYVSYAIGLLRWKHSTDTPA